MTSYYTINDFSRLAYSGTKFQLPESIQKILKVLGDSLSPTDTNDTKKPIVKTNKQFQPKAEDWSAVRSYKTTKIPEVKEGTEKSIKDIRIALNKFSNKNAETQHDVIVSLIKQVISESKEVEEDTKKVCTLIFDIVSANEFYSSLYAKLYKDLIGIFPEFSGKMVDILDKYKESFNNIKVVDPNVDYDGYCDNVKSNDLRRAMSTFIINLAKNQAINESDVLNIILYLEELVLSYAEESEKSAVVEEITENIFIFVTQGNKMLNTAAIWKDRIIPNIQAISKLRKTDPTKYKSMSSRATFKFMDMIDELK
ncbi:MAG: hypothetical protein ACOVRN_09115 [Flavobacterium sp.]